MKNSTKALFIRFSHNRLNNHERTRKGLADLYRRAKKQGWHKRVYAAPIL